MVVEVKDASQRVNILFTWRCDGKCPGCLFGRYVGNGKALDMPVRIAKKVVKGIGRFHEICVAGGEPLSHPKFWKFIGWVLAKNPATLTIVTNGNKFSGNKAMAKRWLSRFNNMAGKASTSIQLIMSVGDFHAKGLKGGQAEMKRRVANVKQVLPKNAAFSFNFLAERAQRQSARAVILKYGLPKKTPTRPWEARPTGGTLPETVIGPHGTVFESEAMLVSGGKPIGHLKNESLKRINRRRFRY